MNTKLKIIKKEEDKLIVEFTPIKEMIYDMNYDLIHNGYISSIANEVALLLVDERNALVVIEKSNYLSPISIKDKIIYEATYILKSQKKSKIKIITYLKKIKVYEGEFDIVILDNHIASLKFKINEVF
jgi:hypothetical protein